MWHDVLLLHGEHVDAEPVHVQQIPQNDGSVQPCSFPPQDLQLLEEPLQHLLVKETLLDSSYISTFVNDLFQIPFQEGNNPASDIYSNDVKNWKYQINHFLQDIFVILFWSYVQWGVNEKF